MLSSFTLNIPRSVLAGSDAILSANAEYGGDHHRLVYVHNLGQLVGFEFEPVMFSRPAVARQLQPITMDDGELREDAYILWWEHDALPTLADLALTFGRMTAFKPDLYLAYIDNSTDGLCVHVDDPFAVEPLACLFGADDFVPLAEPLEDGPLCA
jgi:hypothetical protein